MEATDYCSYPLSLALKKAGFCESCDHIYLRDRKSDEWEFADWKVDDKDYNKRTRPQLAISAPTLWQAQKWLREKKKIDVLVYNCACGYLWEVSKANNGTGLILFDEKGDDENSGCWTSYEAALSAGIKSCVENLLK